MKYLFLLLFIPSCWNDPPEDPTYCWQCDYKAESWLFCDMTQHQIDSLEAIFNTGCEDDSLRCEIDTVFNLIIDP
jgi:hypothetical protein